MHQMCHSSPSYPPQTVSPISCPHTGLLKVRISVSYVAADRLLPSISSQRHTGKLATLLKQALTAARLPSDLLPTFHRVLIDDDRVSRDCRQRGGASHPLLSSDPVYAARFSLVQNVA